MQILDDEEKEMERYLKQFQPRAIRPLTMPRSRRVWFLRVAIVASVILAGGLAFFYAPHQISEPEDTAALDDVRSGHPPGPKMSTMALTKLALDDSNAFDAVMIDQSRMMFPNMRGDRSALRVLAKE